MKPDTRLLIRLTLKDGSMKSWGYDYPYYKTAQQLRDDIEKDFALVPKNTEIHIFYYEHDTTVKAKKNKELADVVLAWLQDTGDYN